MEFLSNSSALFQAHILFSYFFFSPFAIFDVSGSAVPSCYVSTFIFEWNYAEEKVAKLTVVPPQTSFEFIRPRLKKSPLSLTDKMVTILRMNKIKARL